MSTIVSDRELRGSDFSVFVCPQTTKGEIDASPVFVPVRRTEGVTNKTVTYVEDPSVNGAMQGLEQIEDGEELTANISSVSTKQTIQFLIQALHAEETDIEITGTDIEATATGFTSVSEDFDDLTIGDGIWVSGFDTDSINAFYIITGKNGDGEIITYPAPADTEAAGENVTIKTVKSNNADSPTYNAIQTRTVDKSKVGDVDYHTLYDAVVNTFSLEIAETGLANASIAFVAEQEIAGTAAISGQTTAAKPTDKAITSRKNAIAGIRDFYMDNARATCKIKSMSFEINNNYQRDDASACGAIYIRGQPTFSGSAVARSKISNPFDIRDRQRNATRTMFGIRISHGNNQETYIVFRQSVITEASQPNGNNVAANTEFSFLCEEHVTTGSTVAVYKNWV